MERKISYEDAMKYRNGLITYGRNLPFDNPDKLTNDEMQALIAGIFEKIDELDMSMGYPHHDTGIRAPSSVDKFHQEELFLNFIDWYDILPTPNNQVFDYVLNNYPSDKYNRVLCVGDGENVHLGRKLAAKGYQVVSVDPVARKDFTTKRSENNNNGSLHIVQGKFFRKSRDMISWANLIVGSKVTEFAEELVNLNKPTVFNISGNAEIYNMKFKGTSITCSADLERELSKCKGVSVKNSESQNIYVFDDREFGER
ncbi:MAG: hypothetical protein HFJ17_01460 [Clostridia bacterium]|nr:hypothetical protein [Clostridia bacterium]